MEHISESKINEIRNSADIVSIISDYIPLKMQGKNYFGLCPFHDDHSPSMSVSKERQLYKCFVCNKGGNVFNFVKDYENVSYFEAVKIVANKVGIPFDYEYKEMPQKNKDLYEIMDFATNVYQNNLNSEEGSKAKEYLLKRNINDNIIKEFRIGLSLSDNKYLANVLSKKYEVNTLVDLGLVEKDGLNVYDKFVRRIMIPISDLDGKTVGFTGRIYNNEDSAKYINSKETILYKKGHILFNYHNAKPFVREKKSLIVVEGNMDAIRMYSEGVKNVVALMGTTLTKEQISILKKLRVPIILLLDSDNAGEIATLNIGSELVKEGLSCQVVRLSGAKDPDEYIVKFGIEAFNNAIKSSVSYFDYKLISLKENKNLSNTNELISYVKDILKMLDSADNLTKEITLKKISEEYNLDYELLKQEIEFKKEEKVITKVPKKKQDNYTKCVYKILYYLMSDKKYLAIFNTKLGFLKNREERNLVREIEQYIEIYDKINFADFLSYSESKDIIKDLVKRVSEGTDYEELEDNTFLEYLKVIENIINEEEIDKLKEEIKLTTDINEKIKKIELMAMLVKKRSDKHGRN